MFLEINITNSLISTKINFMNNILNGLILKFKILLFFFGEKNNVLTKQRRN